jgi:hypothetical protein
MNNTNNIKTDNFSQLLWSKEASDFLMTGLQWDVNALETRLKSPYPLVFPLPIPGFPAPDIVYH